MRVQVVTIIKEGGQHTSPCNRCAQSAGVFLCVLCVYLLVIIVCLSVWDGLPMVTQFTSQSTGVFFLCFCVLVLVIVCLCVWGWSLLLRDESNTLHLPIHCNCAQEEVAWGFSCRSCWHACASIMQFFSPGKFLSVECGQWRVNLFVCVRNSAWGCLFNCELYF